MYVYIYNFVTSIYYQQILIKTFTISLNSANAHKHTYI